eukprot:1159398-Pelagomonas_calceolata.AAC.15
MRSPAYEALLSHTVQSARAGLHSAECHTELHSATLSHTTQNARAGLHSAECHTQCHTGTHGAECQGVADVMQILNVALCACDTLQRPIKCTKDCGQSI